MNTRSKIITSTMATIALSAALVAGTAFAKEYDGERHGKRGPNIERIAEKLELSEAQTVSFTEIMGAQKEKRQALREAKKAEMNTLKEETLESLSSILDETQLAKIESMMERGKKHRKGAKHEKSES